MKTTSDAPAGDAPESAALEAELLADADEIGPIEDDDDDE